MSARRVGLERTLAYRIRGKTQFFRSHTRRKSTILGLLICSSLDILFVLLSSKKKGAFKQKQKMLSGKNILYGTALYLAAIWGLYEQKKITFKDQKELEATVTMVGIRKRVGSSKKDIAQQRATMWGEFEKTSKFASGKAEDFGEQQKKFVKLEYVR